MNREYTIKEYLGLLKEQLQKYGIIHHQIILDSIEKQMTSPLQVQNQKELRNTILLFSMEEAEHYLPECNIYIKAFVVATIRNSFLESAGSDIY